MSHSQTNGPQHGPPTNANHIFNAIHDALDQWGSSYHHNGMSFFIVTLSKSSRLFRGELHDQAMTGDRMFALQPEHSVAFTSKSLSPPEKGKRWPDPELNANPENWRGYLQSYKTRRDLRLLYIDGMSAAKSAKGTTDTQDNIILNSSDELDLWEDVQRLQRLRTLASDRWKGQIDGVVRMEGGFEVFLPQCEEKVQLVRVVEVVTPPAQFKGVFIEWYNSAATGFGHIDPRFRLNSHRFVTAYTLGLVLWPSGQKHPRLRHLDLQSLQPLRNELDELVLQQTDDDEEPWHDYISLMTRRYTPLLLRLVSRTWTDVEAFHEEINSHMRVTEKGQDLTYLMLPADLQHSSTAGRAVFEVATHICNELQRSVTEKDLAAAIGIIHELMEWLDWADFKYPRVNKDEGPFIPIWPFWGTKQQHHQPEFVKHIEPFVKGGYWDTILDAPKKVEADVSSRPLGETVIDSELL